jgi:hypothetical protein
MNSTTARIRKASSIASTSASASKESSSILQVSIHDEDRYEKTRKHRRRFLSGAISNQQRLITASLLFICVTGLSYLLAVLSLPMKRQLRDVSLTEWPLETPLLVQFVWSQSPTTDAIYTELLPLKYSKKSSRPDYNNLYLNHLSATPFYRQLDMDMDTEPDDDALDEVDESDSNDDADTDLLDDEEYAQLHVHVLNNTCRRNNWRSKYFPTCNTVFEYALFNTNDNKNNIGVEYKGHGAYRDTFLLDRTFIYKSFRLDENLAIDAHYFQQMHREAIIMERLTASPRVVDIYAYCGLTIFAEYMAHEVWSDIIPDDIDVQERHGRISQEDLDELQHDDVYVFNNLTNMEKLNMALVMAESVADIQEFGIIHGDLHPVQYLRSDSGQIKLNDFSKSLIVP